MKKAPDSFKVGFLDYLTVTVFVKEEDFSDFFEYFHLAYFSVGTGLQKTVPLYGYDSAWSLRLSGDEVFRIQAGGTTQKDRVYLRASGIHSLDLYNHILMIENKSYIGDIQVTRVDICQDFKSAYLFDEFLGWLKRYFISEYNTKVSFVGDFLGECRAGRTVYLGSRQSPIFARIYEKGKKEKQAPDWVRYELEIKPANKVAKLQLWYQLKDSLGSLFFLNKWSTTVSQFFLDFSVDVDISLTNQRTLSSLEKSFHHLRSQYGEIMRYALSEIFDGDTNIMIHSLLKPISEEKEY